MKAFLSILGVSTVILIVSFLAKDSYINFSNITFVLGWIGITFSGTIAFWDSL